MKRELKDITKGDIYLVTCTENNKQYIGQARHYVGKNLKPHGANGRWHRHVSKSLNYPENSFSENTIWHAIKTYGSTKFKVEVIEVCNISDLNEKEKFYIKEYDTLVPKGYNVLNAEAKQPHEKAFSEQYRLNASKLHKKTEPDLPMYMVYVKARPEKHHADGYAIINHPESRSKYFTSKKFSIQEKYQLALNYLNSLE